MSRYYWTRLVQLLDAWCVLLTGRLFKFVSKLAEMSFNTRCLRGHDFRRVVRETYNHRVVYIECTPAACTQQQHRLNEGGGIEVGYFWMRQKLLASCCRAEKDFSADGLFFISATSRNTSDAPGS